MERLGKTFKLIRESRNLTLQEVANDDFSVSMLSKFENGKTEISANKLNIALSNIRMTIDEFYHLANYLEYDDFTQLNIDIQNNIDNLDALNKLYNQQIELSKNNKLGKYNILNSIIVASYIKTLDESFEITNEQKQVLSDYLFTIDIWAQYEMLLFLRSIDFLNAKLYLNYAREMVKKIDYFVDFSTTNNLVQTAMIHGLYLSIEEDYELGAAYFNKKAYEYIKDTRDAYMKLMYMFADGYYDIYRKKIEEGKNKIEKSLSILKDLNYEVSYYKDVYKKILKELEPEDN